jgi:hypothetical protein
MIGPLVSFDRITLRKGFRYTNVSKSVTSPCRGCLWSECNRCCCDLRIFFKFLNPFMRGFSGVEEELMLCFEKGRDQCSM